MSIKLTIWVIKMQLLFDFALFVLALPALIVWLMVGVLKEAFDEVINVFGLWLFPAVLSLYAGAVLFIIGPSDPKLLFVSPFQLLSEAVVLGFRVPVWFGVVGAAFLFVGHYFNRARRTRNAGGV